MSTISGKSGERQRGSGRIERTLEVEEEFDLFKLGFVSQPEVAEAEKEETSSVGDLSELRGRLKCLEPS
jgi:hypothetical protein